MIRACCFKLPRLWYLVMAAAGRHHVPWGPHPCFPPLPRPPIAWPRPFFLSSLFTQQPQQAVTCGHQSALGCPTPLPKLSPLPQLGSPLPAGELLLVLANPPGGVSLVGLTTQPFRPAFPPSGPGVQRSLVPPRTLFARLRRQHREQG